MISVSIFINGNPIYTRTAVNRGVTLAKGTNRKMEIHEYELDDGSKLYHDPNDGAVALAVEMLETIKEQKPHDAH